MKSWPLTLRIGIGLLVIGTGPLALFLMADTLGLISDPNPNPVGLGLPFFFTFWPAMVCIVIGLVRLALRKGDGG